MRRDDDDEIGLVLLVPHAAEQRAEHRNGAEPRHLRAVSQVVRLQQAGDREALAVAQLDGGERVALDERRDRGARYGHGVREIELADLRGDAQVDDAVGEHGWRERQTDPERLELDGGRDETIRRGCGDRHREFPAGEEACGVAGKRHEVRLGQAPDHAARLERGDQNIDALAAIDEIGEHHAERLGRCPGERAGGLEQRNGAGRCRAGSRDRTDRHVAASDVGAARAVGVADEPIDAELAPRIP